MDWENERYIRWYTRNLPEWQAMSWHARGLFGLILREMDRAGVLRLGKLGPKGLAVTLHAPWIELERPLQELLDDGCLRLAQDGTALVAPNYIEAQEAKQSDAARKRASRERARALFGGSTAAAEKARAAVAAGVTPRDSMTSQTGTPSSARVTDCPAPVTTSPETSAPVTPCLSVPSEPSLEYPPARDPSAPEQSTEPEMACRIPGAYLQDLWLRETGCIFADGLLDVGILCEQAAAAQSPPVDATIYAERAVRAYVTWANGCPADKRPGLNAHKFRQHFGRVQRILAGLEPAVPVAEEPRPRAGRQHVEEESRPRPRLRTSEELQAKRDKELAETGPPPPEFFALKKKLGGES